MRDWWAPGSREWKGFGSACVVFCNELRAWQFILPPMYVGGRWDSPSCLLPLERPVGDVTKSNTWSCVSRRSKRRRINRHCHPRRRRVLQQVSFVPEVHQPFGVCLFCPRGPRAPRGGVLCFAAKFFTCAIHCWRGPSLGGWSPGSFAASWSPCSVGGVAWKLQLLPHKSSRALACEDGPRPPSQQQIDGSVREATLVWW